MDERLEMKRCKELRKVKERLKSFKRRRELGEKGMDGAINHCEVKIQMINEATDRSREERRRFLESKRKKAASKPKSKPRANRSSDFYWSKEWRSLRYKALRRADGKCQLCGRSRGDGVILHVDHIKPRSRFPQLALDIDNLQILCEDCNLGKSNKCTRDWRG